MILAPHLGISLDDTFELSRKTFIYWQAQYRIDPWGEARADLRNAITSCVIANSNRKERSKAFVPKDFMPDFGSEDGKPKQSAKDMEAVMDGFFDMHNRKVQRQKKK